MNDKNPTLFLDIDGVLSISGQSSGEHNFDTKCVRVLNEIKSNANFNTVLTSDWGLRHDINTMNNIFKFNGLSVTIDDYPISLWGTKFFSLKDLEVCRAEEILQYIKEHQIQDYVVVDDLDMTYWFGDRMVVCKRHNEGIKQLGIKDKILNILNKN